MEATNLKVVLFDLDGTLLDSREIDNLVFVQLMRDYLKLEVAPDTLTSYRGTPLLKILGDFAAPDRMDELLDAWMDYKTRFRDHLNLYPGIQTMLEKLHGAGLRLAVVTSQSDRECALARSCLGMDNLIDLWITSTQVKATKPDPAPVQLALERFVVEPHAAVMVGDTFNDMEAGRRAGVFIGAVLWGFGTSDSLLAYKPDFVFREVEDICDLAQFVEIN